MNLQLLIQQLAKGPNTYRSLLENLPDELIHKNENKRKIIEEIESGQREIETIIRENIMLR